MAKTAPLRPDLEGPRPPSQGSDLLRRARTLWRERRLDVGSLRGEVRWLVVAGLAVCGLGALLIVLTGRGVGLPGGHQQLTGFSVPRLVVPFCYGGLAVSAACIAAAACRRGGPWRIMALLGVALFGTATGATLINAERLISPAPPAFVSATGWTIVALALALPVTGFVTPVERRWLVPVAAGLPFALALAVYAAWGGLAPSIPGFREPLQHRDVLGFQLVNLIGALHIAFVVLVVWTALESAAAARDVVGVAVRVVRPFPAIVGAVLVGKVVWLGFGYAGWLPDRLGGPVAVWKSSWANGPVAWVLAGVFAAGAGAWLARPGRARASRDDLHAPAWALAAGMTFGFGLITALFLGQGLASLWPTNAPLRALASFESSVVNTNVPIWSVVATVGLAAVFGFALLRWRRTRSLSVFLLIFAAWALPRAIAIAWRLLAHSDAPFRSITLVRMDAAVSVAALILGALWSSGRQRATSPPWLLLIVGVSTFLAHPGVALPVGWKRGIPFFLALAFGVVYRFLFDARSLNEPGVERDGRVLSVVGMATLPLTITVLLVAAGLKSPGGVDPLASLISDIVTLFLMVPFAAVLLAARVSDPGSADRDQAAFRSRKDATGGAGTSPARTG